MNGETERINNDFALIESNFNLIADNFEETKGSFVINQYGGVEPQGFA